MYVYLLLVALTSQRWFWYFIRFGQPESVSKKIPTSNTVDSGTPERVAVGWANTVWYRGWAGRKNDSLDIRGSIYGGGHPTKLVLTENYGCGGKSHPIN